MPFRKWGNTSSDSDMLNLLEIPKEMLSRLSLSRITTPTLQNLIIWLHHIYSGYITPHDLNSPFIFLSIPPNFTKLQTSSLLYSCGLVHTFKKFLLNESLKTIWT